MALELQEPILVVADLESAITFYTEVLGLEVRARETGRMAVLAEGERLLVLRSLESLQGEFPGEEIPNVLISTRSTDLAKDLEILQRTGATLLSTYLRSEGQESALVREPSGHGLYLWAAPMTRTS